MNDDILQIVDDEHIPKLQSIIDAHGLIYVSTTLKIISILKYRPCIGAEVEITSPYGEWETGSFLVQIKYTTCIEILMFSCDADCSNLCTALKETKRINWNKKIKFYALRMNEYKAVRNALEKVPFEIEHISESQVWQFPKGMLLQYDIRCPPDVTLRKLEPAHAQLINSKWPHTFVNSENYISDVIEAFGGYGLFLKSNGRLVSWVLGCPIGLSILGTLEEYQNKNYGQTLLRYGYKKIAESGLDGFGGVVVNNIKQQSILRKLGGIPEDMIFYITNT